MNIIGLAPILFAYFHEIEALHSYEDLTFEGNILFAQTKESQVDLDRPSLDKLIALLEGEGKYTELLESIEKFYQRANQSIKG